MVNYILGLGGFVKEVGLWMIKVLPRYTKISKMETKKTSSTITIGAPHAFPFRCLARFFDELLSKTMEISRDSFYHVIYTPLIIFPCTTCYKAILQLKFLVPNLNDIPHIVVEEANFIPVNSTDK